MKRLLLAAGLALALVSHSGPSVAQVNCDLDLSAAIGSGQALDFASLRGPIEAAGSGRIIDVSLCEEAGLLVYQALVLPNGANAQARLIRVDAQSGRVLN